MKKIFVLSALLLAGISTRAQVSQWVAYNDHYRGPNTAPNVSSWNVFTNLGGAPGQSGPMTNFATGVQLPIVMSITTLTNGAVGGTTSSGPRAGTPAAVMFTNKIDWASGTLGHAIQLAGASKIVHAFTGLDPARRYSWHGSAARGGGTQNRWTLLEIGAAAWTDAHTVTSTGVFTTVQIPSLTSSQAVALFSENQALGVVAGWTNIQPNGDGSILIYQTTYRGPLPAGLSFDTGNYGYATVADRLEEFTIGSDTAITITSNPTNLTRLERGSATFSVAATGTPQNYFWRRNGSPIPGANGSSYTIPSVTVGDNNAQFSVIVSNSVNAPVSTAATLTVIPDTTPPAALQAVLSADRTTITISFSEPVDPNTVDPSSYNVYPTGTNPEDGITPDNVVPSNGSNMVLTVAALTPGVNYSVRIFDVYDTAASPNLIVPYPTILPIRPTLELIGFDANNDWKYSTETNLFGTGWETVGYDDTTGIWLSGPAGLGLEASANGVPIRTTTAYAAHSEPQFFRRHFNLPSSTNGLKLSMRYVFEDGAVVYINGQEAGRFNVGAGTLTVATRAPAGASEPEPTRGPVPLPTTNVVPGDNVIAVVVIQNGATSSDIELALELTAEIGTFLTGPPVFTAQPVNQIVSEGQSVTLTGVAEGELPLAYQWHHGASQVGGATSSSYSIANALPSDGGSYYVSATNALGGTNSSTVTLTVNADLTAPVILSAIGGTNLLEVVVTLYDAGGMDLTSAQDASHYQIHLTAGGGNLTVISAVAANVGTNTVVTLTTSALRTAGQNYTVVVNVTDRSAAHNAVTPNTAPIAATVVLFAFDKTWRYDQSGNNLGTAWKETLYDDNAWLSGAGVLGFETTVATLAFLTNISPPNATNTVLSLTNNTGAGIGGTNVTFYFRTTVNVAGFDPAAATLTMRGYIDDGAILYINGTERLRVNYTNAPGYTNFANVASTEATLVVSNLTGLVQGNNVIAVEVHQDAIASSDIDWGMQLEALVTTFAAAGPTVHISINPGTGQVTITWSGGGTLQQAADILGGGAAFSDVPGNPGSPYTFTPTGARKFFRVR